jgi:hypothetical protein
MNVDSEYVLVPREPTPEMVDAGRIHGWDDPEHEASCIGHPETREAIYRAMISAAPAHNPSQAEKGGAGLQTVWVQNLLGYLRGQFVVTPGDNRWRDIWIEQLEALASVPAPAGEAVKPDGGLRWAAKSIIDTFEQDEAQGYRSKDRQFVLSLLRPALAGEFEPAAEAAAREK